MRTRVLSADIPSGARRWLMASAVLFVGALLAFCQAAYSQETEAAKPTPAELEELVGPVALYPDDLLAIVLPASTFPLEIVQAARFLEDRANDSTLEPDADWDDSIVALLNYPEVVRMMNDDLDWTWELGAAVLADQAAVLDAVQAFRDRAYAAGNLRTDDRQIVTEENEVIEIAPADPEVVYIPYYEPERVVVYHSAPAYYYYPYAYPLYYYPYPVGYAFSAGFFWGISSAYTIGWHTHYLHVHHHTHVGHPYYYHHYYDYAPYYGYTSVVVNVNTGYGSNVWYPDHHHHHGGARPYRSVRAAYEGYDSPRRGLGRPASTPDGRAASGAVSAREGTTARPFAVAPGSETQARSGTTGRSARSGTTARSTGAETIPQATTTPRSLIGGVANREGRQGSSARPPSAARSTPAPAVRSEGRTLGRVATESPWRTREDFAAPEARSAPRAPGSRSSTQPSVAPRSSSAPRASEAPRASLAPQGSSSARAAPRSSPAPQSRLGGVSRQSAPQQSRAPSPARSSGGGRAAPAGRAGRS